MSAKAFDSRLQETNAVHAAAVRGMYNRSADPRGAAVRLEHKRLVTTTLRQLRQLRREVVQAEKEIRADASNSLGKARAKSHPFQTAIWGRSAAGTARADEKRIIGRGRDRALAPLAEVKLKIDRAVQALMDEKDRLSS